VSANVLRFRLILVLVLALIFSVIAKLANSPFIGWLSLAAFICAVYIWAMWRRRMAEERRARVLDSEAKTDETRTGPDQ
jgi:membrane protein implicated in regulation of membrane protease activity